MYIYIYIMYIYYVYIYNIYIYNVDIYVDMCRYLYIYKVVRFIHHCYFLTPSMFLVNSSNTNINVVD